MKKQKLERNNTGFQQVYKNSIVALILGASMLFFSCKDEVQKIKISSKTLNLPNNSITDCQITLYDSTYIQFRLTAPQLDIYEKKEEPYNECPQGFIIEKFGKDKTIVSSIRGNYGIHYKKKDLYEAIGNVVSVNEQGDTLKTEKLIFDQKSDRIYTDQFVQIIQQDRIISGNGLESDQNFENWKILKPKGTIYFEE